VSRIFNSRKAMVFNILIVIFTIMILTYGFIRITDKTDVHREIGVNQLDVITKVQEGEKAMIFFDSAINMAAYQGLFELQSRGGMTSSSECGNYFGFNRWNSGDGSTCFVDADSAAESLQELFISNLIARAAAYPTADFVGNLPSSAFERGAALTAATSEVVSANNGEIPISANENTQVKAALVQSIEAIGGARPYNTELRQPTCCGHWVSMVYKWMGYAYRYDRSKKYSSYEELANDHGFPIGYNDNRGSYGHALILLGFGHDAEWWLTRFPDMEVRGNHPRSVSEDEVLIMSYSGASYRGAFFSVHPRNRVPSYIKNTATGNTAEIIAVHSWTPLCEGEYSQDRGRTTWGPEYAGQWSWSNDQAGGGKPWSKYWEPDNSPYYPTGGVCSGSAGGSI